MSESSERESLTEAKRSMRELCDPAIAALAVEFVEADAAAEHFRSQDIPEELAQRWNLAARRFHQAANDAALLRGGKGVSWVDAVREAAQNIYEQVVYNELEQPKDPAPDCKATPTKGGASGVGNESDSGAGRPHNTQDGGS